MFKNGLSILVVASVALLGGCLAEPSTDEVALADHDHDGDYDVDAGIVDDFAMKTTTTTTVEKCASPKVQVCHLTHSATNPSETLCISRSALNTHLVHHGDLIGSACPAAPAPVCSQELGVCEVDGDCCAGHCSGGECRTSCAPAHAACDSSADCCNGGGCFDGVCTPQI